MLPPIHPEPGEVVVAEVGTRQTTHMTHVEGDDARHELADWGACMAMAVRLVARRHGMPLTRVAVRLRPARHRQAEEVDLEVLLDGPLDESQRAYLLGIAETARVPLRRQ